jgi:hypothetical protein
LGIPFIREYPKQSEKDISRKPLVPMLSPQTVENISTKLTLFMLPPDSQIPRSSVKDNAILPDQRKNCLPLCILRKGTPRSPESGPVLVKRTPNDKYRIKVTWRRQSHLFAHLKEKEKLSRRQFLMKS